MEEQADYNVYEQLSETQMSILRIVQSYVGKEKRIRRKALLHQLQAGGARLNDRHMREEISELRERGYPVLGTREGGYYYPAKPAEVYEFIRREIENRARHLHRQEAALRRNIHIHFGQASLEHGNELP